MYVVIVTGGMGSGKSLAVSHLASLGARVLSLDELSHDILATDEEIRDELVGAFGVSILDDDGAVDRKRLAHAAFSSAVATDQLNSIMHPRITRRCADIITESSCFSDDRTDVLVVEVPLITEAPDLVHLADEVLAIEAPEQLRVERATRRDGDREDVAARIALQPTDEQRRAYADTILTNEGDPRALYDQLDRWWETRAEAGWDR